ncbi:hypothetical protein F2Q70_00029966 [Brassica cretica]|uniref:Uncharacterized protein n=1 Tax=Brassica cretica TaxID=69181 RepID=A0A8S9GZ51_BRACR|nr:hypothetical protein F2Q70_00029966 [Brassica cretica]KAF2550230.1 hypothetical protein F2Q68_00034444 [Brassica cretica]KAF3489808.1 hypothetical protein F2Q69_00053232 [Brassica cretica]
MPLRSRHLKMAKLRRLCGRGIVGPMRRIYRTERYFLASWIRAREEGLRFDLEELKQLFSIKRNSGFPETMILAPRPGRYIIDGIPNRDDRWREKFFVFRINPASVGDFDFETIPKEWSNEIVPEGSFAFSVLIQHPAKVILQSRTYQVVSEPLWLESSCKSGSRGYARFTEEWSVCLARGSSRGDEGLLIDVAALVSVDSDAKMYIPSSTRSNKETQLLFSPDPASLEHSICKEARSSSIDNNTCSSLDFRQSPLTQALVPSTNTRSLPSTKNTHLPSIDIFHPTSIDTSVRTSIDTEPRDMVATLILVRDERGDLHDHEGHLRNAAGREAARRRFRSRESDELQRIALWSIDPSHEHRSLEVIQNRSTSSPGHQSTTPTESTASCNTVRIMTHEEFSAKHPHPPSPIYVKIARHSDPVIDRHQETAIDGQPPASIDRRAPLTYRVQMPKIDVTRLNALKPKLKPS